MEVLIKSAKVVDPNSPQNGKTVDILIKNGKIAEIAKKITPAKKVTEFSAGNLHVSPGWFDMHVHFRDPGFEYKEDIISGANAAAFGGFTGVACMPDTDPPIHTKSEIEYVENKAKGLPVDVYPIGAISKNLEGKDMAEMFDMKTEGAVAFSDGKKAVANAQLQSLALLYTKGFDGLVMTYSDEEKISNNGKMNEGEVSTVLGLKGIPALAEELHVARNLFLAEYHDAKIHLSIISTAKSVDLIRQAKKKGVKVTAEVTAHHLALDDSKLSGFDSFFKVKPPLRTKKDITALTKGLKDGTIDAIVSDHSPEDEETKKVEFDRAEFGIIGLETAYAVVNTYLDNKISIEELVEKIALNPRKILQLDTPSVKEGEEANITLFDPTYEWTFTADNIQSKSKNTPFVGSKFKGKALAICNNGLFVAV